MEASVNIETVRARTVLLDALEALGEHLPSIILVGAQRRIDDCGLKVRYRRTPISRRQNALFEIQVWR